MKHKLLTFALMGAFASTMLFSCKNAEEPIPSPGDNNSGEMVEYSISVNITEEMRTRNGSIGELGIYEQDSKAIDLLKYVVYYDDEYVSDNIVTRNDENPFTVTVRLNKATDPTKLYFLFWACNSYNKNRVQVGGSGYCDYIKIDPQQRTVTVNALGHYYGNNGFDIEDHFAGYFQFSETPTNILKKTVLLKRPFAEFHILSDEFATSELKQFYKNGLNSRCGLGYDMVDYENYQSQILYPNIWHFDVPIKSSVSSDYVKNDFEFKHDDSCWWIGNLEGKTPYRTTFKGREMDYLGYFYLFAPSLKTTMIDKSNGSTPLDKLNFVVYSGNYPAETSDYATVQLPEEGIQANYRYIIYNKAREDGGTGFLSPVYSIEVQCDNEWDDTYQSEQGENRL